MMIQDFGFIHSPSPRLYVHLKFKESDRDKMQI